MLIEKVKLKSKGNLMENKAKLDILKKSASADLKTNTVNVFNSKNLTLETTLTLIFQNMNS